MRRRLPSVLHLMRIGAMLAAIPLAGAIGAWSSWENDNAVLQEKAVAVTGGLASAGVKISTISHWIYRNQSFIKNDHFFLIPALGPTPTQVLESGGDCADKSKLVSAMLWQLGIDSRLAQIFPCETCGPIHAFVEAEYEGGRMVVDPVWVSITRQQMAGSLGFGNLPGQTDISPSLNGSVGWMTGSNTCRRRMPPMTLPAPSTSRKIAFTRTAAYGLRLLGYGPEHLLRPHFLEDPKLAITLLLFGVAGILVFVSCILGFAWPDAVRRFRLSPGRWPSSGLTRSFGTRG
jgi:hypothetical protein